MTVVALGGADLTCEVEVSRDVAGNQRAAGARAASGLARVDRPHRVLLLLVDGLLTDHAEMVRGAYAVAGATVPLVGGYASDDWLFTHTYQFAGDADGVEVLEGALIGVAIGSRAPIGLGTAHGWRRSGEPMVVTHGDGTTIYELDNQPATDVFLHHSGQDHALAHDPEAFLLHALRAPLGVACRTGEEVRIVQTLNPVDGSLRCPAGIPQGSRIWVMESDLDSLVRSAGTACRDAVAALGGAPPLGVLTFDCSARHLELGPGGVLREVREMARALPGVPFGGLYTLGEIARVRGSSGIHQLTLVSLAFA